VPIWETVRMIAMARILMPGSVVRLSAGRAEMSFSDQALCFMAGANSIFSSENRIMLTRAVPCADYDADRAMLDVMGLTMRPPFKDGRPAITAAAVGGSGACGRCDDEVEAASR
jgi:biotin synthase